MSEYYIKTKAGSVPIGEWYEPISALFRSAFSSLDSDIYILSNGTPIYKYLSDLESSKSLYKQITDNGWRKHWDGYPGFFYDEDTGQAQYKGKPILLATIHGSKLYGLSHPNSDDDRYIVIDDIFHSTSVRANQVSKDGDDVFVLGANHYLKLLSEGSHQALEAKFSPYAFRDKRLQNMVNTFNPGVTGMGDKYMSGAKSFFLGGVEIGSEKKITNSFRLLKDYSDYLKHGVMFPEKTREQIITLDHLKRNILPNIETF